jgi:hypothetical protein
VGIRDTMETFGSFKMQRILDNHNTIKEVFGVLAVKDNGGNRKAFKEYVVTHNLSMLKLNKNRSVQIKAGTYSPNKKTKDEIFNTNSRVSPGAILSRIKQDYLMPYRCEVCENPGEWMGTPISLVLIHKNGNIKDNRLSNLSLLCPNCEAMSIENKIYSSTWHQHKTMML